ncbi:glycerate dehydrogenase [Providencia heimbachae]|uniref:D-2-hydroxyacid dehydrogenase n=1 Tax=Providencia heimbachae TaxID=333962 RepID=UPI0010BF64AF|nr:D-2-hydroxyacid dehydrogenase [Providencia heimbachae]QCJ71535.1 glycerate dehydrogenase [Providencia heimbachae]
MSIKIVFLDYDTFPDGIKIKKIKQDYELIFYNRTTSEEIIERVKDADVIITNKVKVSKEVVSSAKKLKFISVAATGTDVIDIKACNDNNIAVSNIRNYAINTVPEHTFSLILALRRNLICYSQSVENGRWQEANQFCYFDYSINNLSGSTLGIIGDGVLGKAVADIAKAFGMKVLFSTYKGTNNMGPLYTPFEDVIIQSDIISIHCPLLNSTKNLINYDEFSKMKPSSILINTARGGIVNEEALYDALINKKIQGAGFDVCTEEPPIANSHIMKLTKLPNFILTPHISWASFESIQLLSDMMMDNIDAFLSGSPQNLVN